MTDLRVDVDEIKKASNARKASFTGSSTLSSRILDLDSPTPTPRQLHASATQREAARKWIIGLPPSQVERLQPVVETSKSDSTNPNQIQIRIWPEQIEDENDKPLSLVRKDQGEVENKRRKSVADQELEQCIAKDRGKVRKEVYRYVLVKMVRRVRRMMKRTRNLEQEAQQLRRQVTTLRSEISPPSR